MTITVMARAGFILIPVFLSFVYQNAFSQAEVLAVSCDSAIQTNARIILEKNELVQLIKSKDEPGCAWRDRESGFLDTVIRLAKITSAQEKIDLFNDSSVNVKYYLFPYILSENDSVAFELLKISLPDTTPLVAFCSCMVRDESIGLRLAYLYFGFIDLKYRYAVGGTIDGISFSFMNHRMRPNKKIWDKKLSELKDIVQLTVPGFKSYLTPSSKKEWVSLKWEH